MQKKLDEQLATVIIITLLNTLSIITNNTNLRPRFS